jgi:hypothetical protein
MIDPLNNCLNKETSVIFIQGEESTHSPRDRLHYNMENIKILEFWDTTKREMV